MIRKNTLMLSIAGAFLLAGCGGDGAKGIAGAGGDSKADAIAALKNSDANAVAAQVAATLQACSYDGAPVKFGMGGDAPQNCVDMIAQVMNFTGLPQNFVVAEAQVPNAAAAILLDQNEIPHRVIAFNPDFMDVVKRATKGNVWAAVSIMAHEAGHHLAGHTIQAGGSQPPIELEADKFSGFVLYKMGASRDDALTAIKTLVPAEVPHGATHPPRDRRVGAITEGWDQACQQTGRDDCTSGAPGSKPPPGIAAQVAQSPVKAPDTGLPDAAPGNKGTFDKGEGSIAEGSTLPTVVVLPTPDPKALPTKGMRFVYDEVGILDPAAVTDWEKKAFDHAKATGVEIVTIIAKDLRGMTPEQYGWAMMRQLRVGKLDVGNGAVVVHSPSTQQVGVAMGPGVSNELKGYVGNFQGSRDTFYSFTYPMCKAAGRCSKSQSNSMMALTDEAFRQTKGLEWTVRYQTLADAFQVKDAEGDARRAGTGNDTDTVRQRIIQTSGTLVKLDPAPGQETPRINASLAKDYGRVAYLKTDDGYHVALYFDPQVEKLAPSGVLKEGGRYIFITREIDLDSGKDDTHKLAMLSYVER